MPCHIRRCLFPQPSTGEAFRLNADDFCISVLGEISTPVIVWPLYNPHFVSHNKFHTHIKMVCFHLQHPQQHLVHVLGYSPVLKLMFLSPEANICLIQKMSYNMEK